MPGSVLQRRRRQRRPVAAGLADHVDVFFDNNPVFTLGARRGAARRTAGGVVRQRDAAAQRLGVGPELSRWRRRRRSRRRSGKGRLFLFGPEITFRGQPHGTFKFLFNGIYLSGQAAGKR